MNHLKRKDHNINNEDLVGFSTPKVFGSITCGKLRHCGRFAIFESSSASNDLVLQVLVATRMLEEIQNLLKKKLIESNDFQGLRTYKFLFEEWKENGQLKRGNNKSKKKQREFIFDFRDISRLIRGIFPSSQFERPQR